MNGEPTQRELYDAILNLQGAMLHGFNTIDGRLTKIETRLDRLEIRMTSLEGRMSGLEGRMTTLEGRVTSLEGRMTGLEGRMSGLETRFHEFDEDSQSFRIVVNRRFDHVDRQFAEISWRLA
jgi:uncharacterized coiled-coil protein SlyX